MIRRGLPLAFLLVLAGLAPADADAPYRQVRGVIHLDTTISGGDYDPEEMVRFLRKNDLHVAIFTDHDTVRWDYGIFPMRWIMGWFTGWAIGKAYGRTSSVKTYGPQRYLSLLDDLDRKYDDVIVIPGVEAIPSFYWSGSLLRGDLAMVNGYKHLLAFGMASPEAYDHIPSVGNGFHRGYGIETFLSLWPLALLFIGYKCRQQARRSRRGALYRIPGNLFLLIGILFLLHNFPYKFGKYDQYHGDQGMRPYQDFIDYVVGWDGLVFWAHPEVSVDKIASAGPFKARIRTDAYYEDLLHTHNYTGFAAFAEGMKYVIPPGGIWDRVLAQYCTGKRARPVWAIAEGDVEGDSFSPKFSQTVFLLRENTRQEALQAMKEGRIYAIFGPLSDNLSLTGFDLSGADETATTGQILDPGSQDVHLSATLRCESSPRGNTIRANLIRDGEVVRTFRGDGVLEVAHSDTVASDGRMHYYRLDVRAPNQTRLLSNPIFVRSIGPP